MEDNGDPRERTMTPEAEDEQKDKIFEDILNMLVQELDISPTDITMDMDIRDDLDFDSLQLYEFVIDLEEAYDVRLPDELLDNVKTVRNMVDLVYDRLSTPNN